MIPTVRAWAVAIMTIMTSEMVSIAPSPSEGLTLGLPMGLRLSYLGSYGVWC